MFEGLIHRVLVGYLGRYVKDFHKDQLKLSLWNEEVLLENVELIPEAFDYLRLPFAVKQGRVGKLSIKISWKKLGWDHRIIISLEDVFICASQRDDQEWSLDAVERREFAGKKAKLAAAELAKLSRRMCDNQTGKSFFSYITEKVLESVEVSIRNFHIQYSEMQFNSVNVLFGLKFFSLTVKQNPTTGKQSLVGLSSGKVGGGQVNNLVSIAGLGIYCNTHQVPLHATGLNDAVESKIFSNSSEGYEFDHLLWPFDVSVSVLVNKSGKLQNDSPQYSVTAELNMLAISTNEVQLRQILILLDYLNTSHLREKYGRYHPWGSPLSSKPDGWQKMWWQYAQKSVLSDVRRKLKKSSWRFLGNRLGYRRKYINLYKRKLDLLQHEQSIDEHILQDLEQMEKESDIDDILSYRSSAESEMQEVLWNLTSSNRAPKGTDIAFEKSCNDEHSSGRPRGWLNWLSRGMLGAGGTDDSGQFAGVVSDEVVKDIYEATKFHPSALSSGDADENDKAFACEIKFKIGLVSVTLLSKNSNRKIADLMFKGATIECELREELAVVICLIGSVQVIYSHYKKVVLQVGQSFTDENVKENELASCIVQLKVSPNREVELSVKVIHQPVEATCDINLFLDLVELFTVLRSFEFQHQRVLLSLDGIEDVKTRLASKAEYVLSSHRKLSWDVSIHNIIINVPWGKADHEHFNLVLELGFLQCASKHEAKPIASDMEDHPYIGKQFSNPKSFHSLLMGFHAQYLYNYIEVELKELELKLTMPQHTQVVSILEILSASATSASCVIADESIREQFKVYALLPTINTKITRPICEAAVALIRHLYFLLSNFEHQTVENCSSLSSLVNQPSASGFGFSIAAKLNSLGVHADLGSDGENCSSVVISLQQLDFWYANTEFEECFLCVKASEVLTSSLGGGADSCILISSGDKIASSFVHHEDWGIQHGNQVDGYECSDVCFLLHYEVCRKSDLEYHKFTVELNDTDFHCHPRIFGLLARFYDEVSSYVSSFSDGKFFSPVVNDGNLKQPPHFEFETFGYSNFVEMGSSDGGFISLDCFPFVTISNSGSLGSLGSSLRYAIPDWRKLFKLTDRKVRSPKLSWKKGSKTLHAPISARTSTMGAFPTSGTDGTTITTDIKVHRIRVHFHNSCCIIGTITLPTSQCSLVICEDFVDFLCSTEGLTLASPWWAKNFGEFLWGPALPNISPILNVRVRKGTAESLSSQVEVSIGIQHVYCMLPSEYLAILIGYLSLPDWSANFDEHPFASNLANSENESDILYKYEVLDSKLILPVEQDDHKFIKMELQQLYGSFIPNSDLNDAVTHIPAENVVPAQKIAKSNHHLNIFGRNLVLSLLLCKVDEHGCLMLEKDTDCDDIILIAPLSADVWVRIPCEDKTSLETFSPRTCIMARILNCKLIADDFYAFDCLEALLNVVNQFSKVDNISKNFTSDVLHFLQRQRSPRENREVSSIDARLVFTEVQCCVDSLSIKFCRLKNDSLSSKPDVVADMQFIFSASLINERPMALDIKFSSLKLHSVLPSVVLALSNTTQFASSALHICLSEAAEGRNELHFSLPSLEVWLHIFAWAAVIDICNSYAKRSGATKSFNASRISLQNMHVSTYSDLENMKQESIVLDVRSEDIGFTIHIPVRVIETAKSDSEVEIKEERQQSVSSNSVQVTCYKFVTVTAHSRILQLSVRDTKMNLKCFWEKINGTIGLYEQGSTVSWPFFQLSQLDMMADNQLRFIKLEICCHRVDLWLSHHMFCFWHDIQFDFDRPEASSSYPLNGGIDIKLQLRKVSLLVSDERWSYCGPLLEVLMRNFELHAVVSENSAESTITSGLEVNHNNIHKVFWEPFVEPWEFKITMIRKHKMTALMNSSIATDIHLASTVQFNLNFTESSLECIFRLVEMVKDAWQLRGPNDQSENNRCLSPQLTENICEGKFAPYILQNLTSLPLVYHLFEGQISCDEFNVPEMEGGKAVPPGASVPIYLTKTPEELLFRYKPPQSSDKLYEKQLNGAIHRFMSIQLDGMSLPSAPISMDLVGLAYFEVDFSKTSTKIETDVAVGALRYNVNIEENVRPDSSDGFVVPVVVDVSVDRYTKLIRLYSTVILHNATSIPLQLRFDIPFGVSPKVLDPVYPGQELPLPLHLAEAGRMRWRPIGNSYLWSEVHDLSSIIAHESKIGFLRSFVCYPSYPSSDPFRCCISVEDFSLPSPLSWRKPTKGSPLHGNNTPKQLAEIYVDKSKNSKKRFAHQVTLRPPFIMNNYLPCAVSLTIESGRVTHSVMLSEAENSFHHVDPSHDLGLNFFIQGFRPSSLKFPRAETFNAMAKFSGKKFSLIETMTLYPENSNSGSNLIVVTVEKIMDAFSGARELFLSVPFLLYNCTGLPLNISESASEMKGSYWTIPSCYDWIECEAFQGQQDGLRLLSSDQASFATFPHADSSGNYLSEKCIVSRRNSANSNLCRVISKRLTSSGYPLPILTQSDNGSVGPKATLNICSSGKLTTRDCQIVDSEPGKVNACMFSPYAASSVSELTVKVSRCHPEQNGNTVPNFSWSAPFLLVPPSGSSTVLVPQSSSSSNGSFIISVTSSALDGPLAGRTRAITFQPRYVISNACTKDLCYKQKGTEFSLCLGIGQHSYLFWTNTMRKLLVSICFGEPGWQWSGSFLPDHLGDTQVKMRNNDGSIRMIRAEVQNADVSIRDEKIIGSLNEASGTNLIILSEDNSGFMPYRIDNFSKERLRVYQQKCESFDTIIHPYTSCPYAWDEPCYPHRLTVEVPGERIVGLYDLDNQKESTSVHLKSTSEKPERTLFVSVHAEGATKVLSIVDSSFHILTNVKDSSSPWVQDKSRNEKKPENYVEYKRKYSISLACIGISLINASPQELLFASAKNITFDLLQSLDCLKLSFQISSFQIDNQLAPTPYPVILSFNQENQSSVASQGTKDDGTHSGSEKALGAPEPVLSLAVATWGKKDLMLFSVEYIILRIANFHLELEQNLVLSLLDLFRAVLSRFQSKSLPLYDATYNSFLNDAGFMPYHHYDAVGKRQDQLPAFIKSQRSYKSLPSVVPIGAPWQQIYLRARRHKKIYVELFDLAPIEFSLSFSSSPWTQRNGAFTLGESLIHRGLIALADVEGAQIHLKQLTFSHQMASLESMQDILIRHYTRQLLHEMYKVFGSAGVIGNPMGFARSLGLGIRDFLSVPTRSILQNPSGLVTGMAQGTTSLVSHTVYALSDAATQFSKAAHKGIVALTFDDQSVATMEKHQKSVSSHSKGVINGVLEGLTGLLQSPIKEVEKHGLPGVLSGIALGVTGLVARPAASILEVTGKTAQSIRNRSRIYQVGSQRYRARFPRPLSRDLPLKPYSIEEAIGMSVLMEAEDGLKFKDEQLMMCKSLKQAGNFAIITGRLMLVVSCSSLVHLGKPEFRGVPIDPEWSVESEISLDGVIHADTMDGVVHIVGSDSDVSRRLNHHQIRRSNGGTKTMRWSNVSTPLPLFQTNLELVSQEDAQELLHILMSTIEQGKGRGWGTSHVLRQISVTSNRRLS